MIRDNNGRVGLRPCDQSIPAWMPWNLALLACALHLWWITILLKAWIARAGRGNSETRAAGFLLVVGRTLHCSLWSRRGLLPIEVAGWLAHVLPLLYLFGRLWLAQQALPWLTCK